VFDLSPVQIIAGEEPIPARPAHPAPAAAEPAAEELVKEAATPGD
jgi:hypothetical protein